MRQSFLDLVIRVSWFVFREKSTNHESRTTKRILFLFLISAFILHPSSFILAQHTRLYACALGSDDPTAFMGGSSMGGGLWQSDDTGKTWKQLGWKHVKCYSVDVVEKSNGRVIYEACGNGVLRSIDSGANWRMVTDWRITEVMDIAVDQEEPNNIYIATPGAIWKSDDGGDNWYEADSDIPYPIFVSRIKIDPRNHLNVYAATESGLYQSGNAGLSWNRWSDSNRSVKDFLITSGRISAWIEERGIMHFLDSTTWKEWNFDTVLWSIYGYDNALVLGSPPRVFFGHPNVTAHRSPQNVHSALKLDNEMFFGSLSSGMWLYPLDGHRPACGQTGLNSLQIWRIKAVEIK
jgi:hypothetical protein